MQIVDARNPLLFRCEDLECYVKEVDASKENVILINKADLLTAEQRSAWASYFEKEDVQVIFWSALAETTQLNGDSKEQLNRDPGEPNTTESENSSSDETEPFPGETEHLQVRGPHPPAGESSSDEDDSEYEDCQEEEEEDWRTCSEEDSGPEEEVCEQAQEESCAVGPEAQNGKAPWKRQIHNLSHLVSKQELLDLFKQLHTGRKVKDGQLTVGLVRRNMSYSYYTGGS